VRLGDHIDPLPGAPKPFDDSLDIVRFSGARNAQNQEAPSLQHPLLPFNLA
jgi:hypothetical protein